MFRYIGIRGHRGAGKNTFSYLLGLAINHYLRYKNFNDFGRVYARAVERVQEDENFIDEAEFNHIIFESFADTAKIMISQMLNIPIELLYDDWGKDSTIICFNDFSYVTAENKEELNMLKNKLQPMTCKEFIEDSFKSSVSTKNKYISLREFMSYFSKVMQNNFGRNVWIKSLMANESMEERFYANDKIVYKIFTDCKFTSEISYISNKNGKIIEVTRLDNKKEDTDISKELDNDNRIDYKFDFDHLGMDLMQYQKDIESLTLKILDE